MRLKLVKISFIDKINRGNNGLESLTNFRGKYQAFRFYLGHFNPSLLLNFCDRLGPQTRSLSLFNGIIKPWQTLSFSGQGSWGRYRWLKNSISVILYIYNELEDPKRSSTEAVELNRLRSIKIDDLTYFPLIQHIIAPNIDKLKIRLKGYKIETEYNSRHWRKFLKTAKNLTMLDIDPSHFLSYSHERSIFLLGWRNLVWNYKRVKAF